jgi:hypothetical protein
MQIEMFQYTEYFHSLKFKSLHQNSLMQIKLSTPSFPRLTKELPEDAQGAGTVDISLQKSGNANTIAKQGGTLKGRK